MDQDADQLKLLSVFHYVVGAIAGLFSLLPIVHLVVGIHLIRAVPAGREPFPPAMIGWLFAVLGAAFVAGGFAFAAGLLLAGRFLALRRHYTFCLVVAGIACLFVPFGTVLGVFTIVVLQRSSVKSLFPPGAPA